MATAITADNEAPEPSTKEVTIEDQRAAIKTAAEEIYELEQERAAVNEKIRKVKQGVIKPIMNLGDFNPMYQLWKRERDNDDGEEQARASLSSWRLAFDALKRGGQASLFSDQLH